MRDQQKPLLDMGIGTFYLDNFSARGVKDTYRDQSTVTLFSAYIDSFMALEFLANQKVNKKKIGITGYSRGGNNSLMIQEKKIRDALVDKSLYFAAAQPRSPECYAAAMFENPTPIPETKVWLVHGGADDYTLPGPCVEYGKNEVKANGGDIKIDAGGKKDGITCLLVITNLEKCPEIIFHRCPPVYSKETVNGTMKQ